MTTTSTRHQLCTPGSCSHVYPNGDPCPYEDRDDRHHGPAGVPNLNRHEFVEHTHLPECDAALWELLGCTINYMVQEGWYECYCVGAVHAAFANGRLAPILSDPSADASWLAMRDVIRWGLDQGWELATIVTKDGVRASLDKETEGATPVSRPSIDALPRAVGEAAIAALRDRAALGAGE